MPIYKLTMKGNKSITHASESRQQVLIPDIVETFGALGACADPEEVSGLDEAHFNSTASSVRHDPRNLAPQSIEARSSQ